MSTEIQKYNGQSLIEKVGQRYGVEAGKFMTCLKETAFKGASNEQLMALLIVADQYQLNPFTKEIYAFPDKRSGGIVPVVGIDGWLRIINNHPQFDGMEYEQDAEKCKCRMYRKDRSHAIEAIEFLSECYRKPTKTKEGVEIPGPWQTHPARMLRHKATIQAARLAFGYSGIKDPDEAERIIEVSGIERVPVAMPVPRKVKAIVEPIEIEPDVNEPEAVEQQDCPESDPQQSHDNADIIAKISEAQKYKGVTFKKLLKAEGLTEADWHLAQRETLVKILSGMEA